MRFLRITVVLLFLVSIAGVGYSLYIQTGRDVTPPVITATDDEIHLSVKDSQDVFLKGLTAVDDRDGDITDKIIIERISRFTEPGVSEVSYVVFDKGHNPGKYKRTVYFDDYVAPRLYLEQPLLFYATEVVDTLARIRLWDCIDGDISNKIKLEASNVNTTEPGIYEVELSAVTKYGDEIHARLPLNIVNYSADEPEIILDNYLVYTKKGQPLNPLIYVKKAIDTNGTEMNISDIKVSSQVDLNKVGSGQMLLQITNERGKTGITYLTVIVEE